MVSYREINKTEINIARMDPDWRDQVRNLLSASEATVVFEKLDGEMRTMRCTLIPEFLPEKLETPGEVGEGKEKNKDAVAVFDLDKQAWRSFRFDKLIDLSFKL